MGDIRKERAKNPDLEITCYVCENIEPLATAEDHHVKPRAFGGDDTPANRKWLCASCHTRVHKIQGMLVRGDVGKAHSLSKQIFPVATTRGRLWDLGNAAARAEKEMKDLNFIHKTHQKVSLNIELDVWSALKKAAKAQKIPATALAAQIIAQTVQENYDVSERTEGTSGSTSRPVKAQPATFTDKKRFPGSG